MLGWLHQKLTKVYQTPVSAWPLALFRIIYGLILIGEVGHILYFRHLIFDPVPYLQLPETDFLPLLLLWLVVLVCLVLGLFTRLAVILNYAFSLATFALFSEFKYHIDHAYVGINFLLLLAPVSAVWSLDAKLNTSARRAQVSSLWPYLIFFFGVGFTYLDSVFYKLADPIWRQGWGVWYASSLLPNIYQDFTPYLNSYSFMQVLGYGVLLFEIVAPVLIFFRKGRLPLLLFGIIFHLGTLLVYPIPGFALASVAFYLPMLALLTRIRYLPHASNILFQDLSRLTIFPEGTTLKLASAFVLYCCFGQFLCLLQNDVGKNVGAGINLDKAAARMFVPFYYINQKYLGIVPHEIFLNRYFAGYNHIIAVEYQSPTGDKIWLPLTEQSGMNGYYNTGRIFCNWNYWVNSAHLNQEKLKAGLRDYTAFWAHKNDVSLQNATFTIKLKKMEVPVSWQPDFLQRHLQKPWQVIGEVVWQHGDYIVKLPEVESL